MFAGTIGHLWLLLVLKPICEICRWCAEKSVIFSVGGGGNISRCVERIFPYAYLVILLDVHQDSRN